MSVEPALLGDDIIIVLFSRFLSSFQDFYFKSPAFGEPKAYFAGLACQTLNGQSPRRSPSISKIASFSPVVTLARPAVVM